MSKRESKSKQDMIFTKKDMEMLKLISLVSDDMMVTKWDIERFTK